MTESFPGAAVTSGSTQNPENSRVLQRATLFLGAAAAFVGILGLTGMAFGFTLFSSVFPGYRTMAFSTAVLFIILGPMLAYQAVRQFRDDSRILALLAVAAIAAMEAFELSYSFSSQHSFMETQMVRIGDFISGQQSSAISPGTSFFIILWLTGFFLLLAIPGRSERAGLYRNVVSVIGLSFAMVSFTFLLSYAFGEPFLYGTRMIPIAAPTTIALTFLGVGLVTAAGPESFPARYFVGDAIGARLLRTFLPLTVVIIFAVGIIFHETTGSAGTSRTILVSASLVIFSLLTGYVVYQLSRVLGGALEAEERKRKAAEDELARNNENLTAVNEELLAQGEELKGNLDELTRKDKELQESEEKYRSLFDNLLEGYAYCRMIYGTDGRPEDFIYLEVNRAFDRITGVGNIKGKRATEVFPGIHAAYPQALEIFGRVALSGIPETLDLDFRLSGKWLHISVYSPAKEYFVAIFEDITGRRKSEEVQALLASIVTQSEDAVYTETLDGMITSWNAGATKMYGYPPEEAVGNHADFLAPPECSGEIESVLHKVRAGEPVVNHETIRLRKNGERFTVSLSISPLRNANGEIIRASTIVRDITEQKRAQIVLEQINRKLSLLNSITHHDAGNNISGLRAYLGLIADSTEDPVLHTYLDKIETIVEDLTEQIEFTRSYQNLGMKNPEWQDVTGLIERLSPGPIQIKAEVHGLKIFADPLLGNVFYNLLDNAVRHGEHVTEISVTARENDDGLVLVWEDNGAGVPDDIKARIFDRGFGKNTGLGLFLIREILSISGITIQENGTPGEGARFEISRTKRSVRIQPDLE